MCGWVGVISMSNVRNNMKRNERYWVSVNVNNIFPSYIWEIETALTWTNREGQTLMALALFFFLLLSSRCVLRCLVRLLDCEGCFCSLVPSDHISSAISVCLVSHIIKINKLALHFKNNKIKYKIIKSIPIYIFILFLYKTKNFLTSIFSHFTIINKNRPL